MEGDWESQVTACINELRKGYYLPRDHQKMQEAYRLIHKGMENGNKEKAKQFITKLEEMMMAKDHELWRGY